VSLDTGYALVIGFIGFLQLVTTNNYNALVNSHTLQLTIIHFVFADHLLVTVSNNADSSISVLDYSDYGNYFV
jgi:hypothetical protein